MSTRVTELQSECSQKIKTILSKYLQGLHDEPELKEIIEEEVIHCCEDAIENAYVEGYEEGYSNG